MLVHRVSSRGLNRPPAPLKWKRLFNTYTFIKISLYIIYYTYQYFPIFYKQLYI